jgi:hypothetical protein
MMTLSRATHNDWKGHGMTLNFGKVVTATALAAIIGTVALADTDTPQPVDPLLVLWPEGTTPPQPPVRQIRITWSTGVFR